MYHPIKGHGKGRGRGRNQNPNQYSLNQNEYPSLGEGWVTPKAKGKGKSESTSAKDVLLTEQYFLNTVTEEILFYIESEDVQLDNPWDIKEKYLQNQSFLPHFDQYRYVYENMLIHTASVAFEHHHVVEGNVRSPISFSRAIIAKILTPQQWGTSLNQCKILSVHEQKYNYWDYQKAFYNAFYYQNPIKSHSWFFRVDAELPYYKLPVWFSVWWETFGPDIEILPEPLQILSRDWMNIFLTIPPGQNQSMFNSMILFFIKFNIPWIWKWDLRILQKPRPCLKRQFFTKWWTRFNQEPIIVKIEAHIKAMIASRPKLLPANPFTALREQLKKQCPTESDAVIFQKTIDYMKDQLEEAYQFEEEIDDKSMASASADHVLAGESQAPPEDTETMGEYWDALTEMMKQKIKGKGKSQQ